MTSAWIVFVLFYFVVFVSGATTSFFPAGRLVNVTVNGGAPSVFKIRGFSYSNSRIGEGAAVDSIPNGYDVLMRPRICQQDFSLMRTLNVNLIKLYAFNVINANNEALHQQCLDIAWNNGVKPIFVLLSVWIPSLPFGSQGDRQDMLNRYATMVKQTHDHPAVFGYSIGSEIGGDPNNNKPYWDDFKLLINTIRDNKGASQKIITTGAYQADNNNPHVPCLGHVINGEANGANVDAWGVDIYSPNPDEPNLRQNIFRYTKKPFFFPEYGLTFQPSMGDEHTLSQRLLATIAAMEKYSYSQNNAGGNQGSVYDPNAPIFAGGLVFEWNDEYWKAPLNNNCQPNSGSAQPYFGSNKVQLLPGCSCVPPEQRSDNCYLDQRVPRQILSSSFLPTLWPTYEPNI